MPRNSAEMAASSAEKPKGPSIEGVSRKAPESAGDRMKRLQSMEKIAGKMEDFGEEISVEVAMGKDREKRPGSERGEDMFLADKETGLTGVFDGLGGDSSTSYTGRGADASNMAAQFAPSLYKVLRKRAEGSGADLTRIIDGQASFEHPSAVEDKKAELEEAWNSHDPAIKEEIVALYDTVTKLADKVRETGGMTTVTLGRTVSLPDGRVFEVIANVGDSGAVRIDAEGKAEDATQEDSAVDYLLSRGVITPEQAADPNYEVQPGKTIKKLRTKMYQALGAPTDMPLVPRISVVELKPGDKIVYATDGIRDVISTKQTAEMSSGGAGKMLDEVARADAARGGDKKGDEMTVLIKERYASAEVLEAVEDGEEVELDEGDIIEAA